jgi:hypothetical protein
LKSENGFINRLKYNSACELEEALDPGKLVGATIRLDKAPARLAAMGRFNGVGVTVIDRF